MIEREVYFVFFNPSPVMSEADYRKYFSPGLPIGFVEGPRPYVHFFGDITDIEVPVEAMYMLGDMERNDSAVEIMQVPDDVMRSLAKHMPVPLGTDLIEDEHEIYVSISR